MSQLNIGNIDRALRILVGLILVALAAFGLIGIWGYIGVILIATGMIAICPLYTLLGVPRGDATGMLKQFRKNYDFFDAPVGMILCVERRMGGGQWIDCGIFLDQLMLLAREKGLHTCPQAAFSRYQHIVRRELKIPDDEVVICGLALGQADPDAVPNNLITERAPLQDFATWYDE